MTHAEAVMKWTEAFAADRARFGPTHGLAGSRCYLVDPGAMVLFVKLPGNHDVAEALAGALDAAMGEGLRDVVSDLLSSGLAAAVELPLLLLGGLPDLDGEFALGGFVVSALAPVSIGMTSLGTRYPLGVTWFGPQGERATVGHLWAFGSYWPEEVVVRREALQGCPVDGVPVEG